MKNPALARMCRYMETKTARLVRAFIYPTYKTNEPILYDPEEYEQ